MRVIFLILLIVLQIWVLCAVARALISWFPIKYDTAIYRINRGLVAVTEPIIAPVRRMLPAARVGNVGVDLSFLVVLLVIQFLVIPFLRRHT
ncbi:MAG TPA: YggT family protein [Acidimicrobiales bacterium]|jgi:YggT family protein